MRIDRRGAVLGRKQHDPDFVRMDRWGRVTRPGLKGGSGSGHFGHAGKRLNTADRPLTDAEIGAALDALFSAEKAASTPTGASLPAWEGQVEITPEDVADALRDWDAKLPRKHRGLRGLLLTERPE